MGRKNFKSKLILLTLISVLFVSCGGGGGSGGSSNLPLNPGNPNRPNPNNPGNITDPNNPVNPNVPGNLKPNLSDPTNFPTVNNPLDELKNSIGITALKTRLENERKEATEMIASDTREIDGKVNGVDVGKLDGRTTKMAILDTDFLNRHYATNYLGADFLNFYSFNHKTNENEHGLTTILNRLNGDTNSSDDAHGEFVYDVLRGFGGQNGVSPELAHLKIIAASVGNVGHDPENRKDYTEPYFPNFPNGDPQVDRDRQRFLKDYGDKILRNTGIKADLATYRDVLENFGNQKVKIFNQSWGTDKSIKDNIRDNEGNIKSDVFKESVSEMMDFYKDTVNNKGGLFVWAAGDRTTDNKDMNDVRLEAGLPYFDKELEKGWIAAIGVNPIEEVRYSTTPPPPAPDILDRDKKKWLEYYRKTYFGYQNRLKEVANGKLNIHRIGKDKLAYAGAEAKYWSISASDRSRPMFYWGNSSQSTYKREDYVYTFSSAFAAARVSRAAAMVSEKYDWMTADQIRQTLFTTTDEVELSHTLAVNNNEEARRRVKITPDDRYGWGMLNQERALKGPGAFINVTSNPKAPNYFEANIPAQTTSVFSNKIWGNGSLIKSGEGTLHLTQNNSYSGGSIVNGGVLEIHQVHASPVVVNKNGTLTLHSKSLIGYEIAFNSLINNVDAQKITTTGVKLANLGKVIVNGTTSIVGGDYVAYKGSKTIFNNGAKLNVLGKIKVEDATMKVMSNEYVTNEGKKSTLMQATSIEGNIASVETNGMRTANVEVKNGKVVATMSRQNPVEYVGEEALASTKNVAGNVENVFQDLDRKIKEGTATKEELAMGATIQNMERETFATASEMMSGEIYASAQALTFSQAQNINRDLSNRLSGLDNFKNSNKDSEVWFSAIGSGGKLRRDGYASADTRVTGGQFGIDTKFEGTTTLGVAMNYSYAKANFNRYAGESKSNMVGVSFYGKQELPYGFYTAGRLGLSNISSKVERELLTSTGETLTGKINHHDKMLSAYVEIGKKIGWFTPFIGYSQDYLRRGSFNESEASWGVKADSKNYRATNFLVGARAEYVADKYKLQAYVTQAINTDKRDLTYEGNFTGSNVKQKFQGVKQAKNTTWIGFGVFRELSPVFGVYGNVDFRVEDKKWADSVISTGLQYRF
ncbi:autotransporter serine protease fusolisin [Fusobacterium nucleatum]|nr:autotransporter serine protease fusolisin [Fusobacterium nucleatum]WDF24757.1 autotransporter serine protease fusolisin [Fusobacterium nucleatum]